MQYRTALVKTLPNDRNIIEKGFKIDSAAVGIRCSIGSLGSGQNAFPADPGV